MTFWQAVTWETARASGLLAYILFTGSVAVGLALTQHWQNREWPRLINAEMHNFLALVGLVFTGVHVLAVLVDPFTHFSVFQVVTPFVSSYRPIWMGLGITGLYLGFAILISTWLRPKIGYVWWRRLHVLTLLAFALVTVHGIATGSDTRTWYGVIIYGGAVALVGTLLIKRLMEPATAQAKSHPVISGITGGLLGILALFAYLGPLQAGWSGLAGGQIRNTTSVASGTTPAATTAGDPFANGFTDTFTGALAQTGPDASGITTMTLTMSLAKTGGTALVRLTGQDNGGGIVVSGSDVTLGTAANPTLYHGTLTSISSDTDWRFTGRVNGTGVTLTVRLDIRFTNTAGTAIAGSIQGATRRGD